MNEFCKLFGIPGSLRRSSYNRAVLIDAQSMLPDGVSLEIFNLEGIPLFNQVTETRPARSDDRQCRPSV